MAADLILHWSSRSPFVRKVMVAAHELGLAHRIKCVPTTVSATAPNLEHLAVNPLGRIPCLVLPGGLTLFESQPIIEYLNEGARGMLVPPAGPQRLHAMRWHALGTGLLEVLVAWHGERARPSPHHVAMAGYEAKTRATLDLLEREAGAIRGASFAIGHIALGCLLGYLDFRFGALQWREGRPWLAAWGAEFDARASARETKPHDDRR
jgi:glutathione S-transferase